MSRHIFQIEQGQFGLKIVDKAAVGYQDTWQAPGGKTLATVSLTDYETASTGWTCQINSGALEATPDTTTTDVDATWCEPAESIPTPGKTTFEWVMTFLQDPDLVDGLNMFLFEHDTEEAYMFASMNGGEPPKIIGRVRLASGTIGGAARTTLTADLTLPFTRKPDIEFGNATTSEIVTGAQAAVEGASQQSAPEQEPVGV